MPAPAAAREAPAVKSGADGELPEGLPEGEALPEGVALLTGTEGITGVEEDLMTGMEDGTTGMTWLLVGDWMGAGTGVEVGLNRRGTS